MSIERIFHCDGPVSGSFGRGCRSTARSEKFVGRRQDGAQPRRSRQLGVKRSVMVDAAGIPIGLATDGANRNDCKLTEPTILSIAIEPPEPTVAAAQGVCLDKA
jgi:hypothetical protein